ncbi:MAG: DUF1353 domain-containing protein [bacterium]|nr:DUF1353 domain-containing protein [bacterium]
MRARLPQPALAFEPGGALARLARDYRVAAWPVAVAVRTGFRYDGASVPEPLRPLVGGPWEPLRLPAATVHDWLYASHAVPKWVADLVFLRLLAANGMPPWRALADWWAVARFGAAAWRSHGPEENRRARTLGEISVFGLRVESGNDKTTRNRKERDQ